MAYDYKRTSGYKPKLQLPGWMLFASGLAVGAFAAFLFFLNQQGSGDEARVVTVPLITTPGTVAPQTDPKDSALPPPRFDFYTLLPEQEVVIPDPDSKEVKEIKEIKEIKEAKPAKATKPEAAKPQKPSATPPIGNIGKKGSYVLQVGSFKKMEEADRLRAALALLGIESSVQVVRIGDNDNWHRVRIGPFDDTTQANLVRSKLKQNKYNSILLQVKA